MINNNNSRIFECKRYDCSSYEIASLIYRYGAKEEARKIKQNFVVMSMHKVN
jgi:hypothetical protein